jgi:sugar (pentulose or hexulose) kinase
MSFIGIDLGTSFIKGAVLDLDSRQLQHIYRLPFPEPIPNRNPLFMEFDPQEMVSVCRNLLETLSAAAPDCEGIVLCTQMHGMVLVDQQHRAQSPCLTWRDQRATMPHPSGPKSYFEVMSERITPEQRAQLGNELRPGTPSSFLFWMAERGELQGGLMPVSIPDFVVSTLAGSDPSVESTNAMAYGLFNLQKWDWHRDVIESLRLSDLRWPRVRRHGEVIGHLMLGAREVPFYTPVGDYQCALLGALLESDELSLNISTGSQVSRLTPRLKLGDYQSRPYFDGKFLNTFTHIPAGRSLDVLMGLVTELARRKNLEIEDPWEYIAEEALRMRSTDLEVDLNFFSSPFGNRGSVANIRQDNLTVGHLFRAAFNNMTERYYNCAARIWPERGWHRIVFSGGLAAKIEALRQTILARFETGYRLAPYAEDTLTGLMILALAFSGRCANIEQASAELRRQTAN